MLPCHLTMGSCLHLAQQSHRMLGEPNALMCMKTLDNSLPAGIGPLEAVGFVGTKGFFFIIIIF